MIIFLLVALSIYSLINLYIIRRGWQALSGKETVRNIFLAVFLFLALSYPAARFAECLHRGSLSEVLVFIGAFYLALMVYLLLLVFLVDIVRLGNKIFHFFPSTVAEQAQKAGQIAFLVVGAAALMIVVGGIINALHLRLRTLDLSIDKSAGEIRSLNIALVSDIHLGTIVRSSRLEKIVERINELKADLVLMPGDIADEDISLPEQQKMAAVLRKLQARYGVFSVTGNHEYYGGLERNLTCLRQGNVRVLMDEAVKVGNCFYVLGRKDLTARQFAERRKSLAEILEGVDPQLPLILLDHQPVHLEEAEQNGIDLQLSGHTHNGQLFPLNLINKFFYEDNWGYLRKGKTQYYVTCGVGTWGPPLRTASVPEIVQIRLRFR
jgi:hypothetical protein